MSDQTAARRGRPFVFTDPEELRTKVQTYFDNCDPHIVTKNEIVGHREDGMAIMNQRQVITSQRPYTITGLALHLGVTRQTLVQYKNPEHYSSDIKEEVRDELINTVESAIARVEVYNEEQLHLGNANGVKFNLTNNFGWVDRQEVNQNTRTITDDLNELESDLAEEASKELEESSERSAAKE